MLLYILVLYWPWAARYDTWLLITLTPKGVVFSVLLSLVLVQTAQASQKVQTAAAAAYQMRKASCIVIC